MKNNTHTSKCPKTATSKKGHLKPTTDHLKTIASKHEKNANNNNVFNGKNISDHTKSSQYYQTKAKPEIGTQIQKMTQNPKQLQSTIAGGKSTNFAPVFTEAMLNHYYDDNAMIKASKMPSSLVEVPRVNEKYEISSFQQTNYYKGDLKSVNICTNKANDPFANINAQFFNKTYQNGSISEGTRLDPFSEVFLKQKEFQPASQNSVIKDLIYRTDFDHPLSFHNQTIYNQVPQFQAQYPPLVSQQTIRNTKLVQNGFYSKEPFSLVEAYPEPQRNPYLTTLDERLVFQEKENYQTGNVFLKDNLFYQANQDLLKEIQEKDQQLQINQSTMRQQESNMYQIDQVSPGGTKHVISIQEMQSSEQKELPKAHQRQQPIEYTLSPGKESQISLAPRIEEQYMSSEDQNRTLQQQQQHRNVLSIKMRENDSPFYQSSPGGEDLMHYQDDDNQNLQMQPKGNMLFKDGEQFIDKYPIMDEQCRKELPVVISYTEESKKSPHKSVRFTGDAKEQNDGPQTSQSKRSRRSGGSRGSKGSRGSRRGDESGQSSGIKSSQQRDSEDEDEYDDEDDEGEEEDDEESDGDEQMDYELQQKLEKIKKNLKDTNSTSQNRDETMNKLEDVLKRQRERLENISSYQNTISQKQNQYQTQNTNGRSDAELSGFELTKNSPGMETAKTHNNLEKAYEELEKEILDIKSKLQKSLGASQGPIEYNNRYADTNIQSVGTYGSRQNVNTGTLQNTAGGDKSAKGRHSFKSPGTAGGGELDEHDYSLSVSDLNNSLYNSSRGMGLQASDVIPPKFKY